jgi:hypothetical protein
LPGSNIIFNEVRRRDATAAIRGFVYQVDVTLLRWLSLQEDEHLELEILTAVEQLGSPAELADTLNTLATINSGRKDDAKAEQYYTRALAVEEAAALEDNICVNTLLGLGYIAARRRNFVQGHELISRAIPIVERLAPNSLGVSRLLIDLARICRIPLSLWERVSRCGVKISDEFSGTSSSKTPCTARCRTPIRKDV